jgi:hypothetical protein
MSSCLKVLQPDALFLSFVGRSRLRLAGCVGKFFGPVKFYGEHHFSRRAMG